MVAFTRKLYADRRGRSPESRSNSSCRPAKTRRHHRPRRPIRRPLHHIGSLIRRVVDPAQIDRHTRHRHRRSTPTAPPANLSRRCRCGRRGHIGVNRRHPHTLVAFTRKLYAVAAASPESRVTRRWAGRRTRRHHRPRRPPIRRPLHHIGSLIGPRCRPSPNRPPTLDTATAVQPRRRPPDRRSPPAQWSPWPHWSKPEAPAALVALTRKLLRRRRGQPGVTVTRRCRPANSTSPPSTGRPPIRRTAPPHRQVSFDALSTQPKLDRHTRHRHRRQPRRSATGRSRRRSPRRAT